MDHESIQMRLAECIAWCAPRALAGDSAALRTRELLWLALYDVEEVFDPRPPAPWAGEPDSFNTYDYARLEVVETVAVRRAEALRAGREYPTSPPRGLAGGMLLAFHPMTLNDGALEEYSGGFFDEYDEPPWDTWLWFVNEEGPARRRVLEESGSLSWMLWDYPYLISWVPPQLRASVSAGIRQGDSMHSLWWLDHIDSPFTRQLRSLGILDAIEGA